MKTKTIQRDITHGGQTHRLVAIYAATIAHERRRLRIDISLDNSYAEQSRATIDLWTAAGWTRVADIPARAIPGTGIRETRQTGYEAHLAAAETRLLALAEGVLA